MKNRSRLMALAVMAAAVSAAAQEHSLNLGAIEAYVPTVGEVMTVTKPGVNLRKAPTTTSPKLMLVWPDDDEGGDALAELSWSNAAPRDAEAAHPSAGELFPLIAERNGWVNFSYSNYLYSDKVPVWMSADFCHTAPFTPLTDRTETFNNEQRARLCVRRGGAYDGLCIYMAKGHEELGDASEAIMFGRIVDGVCVLPLYFNGSWERSDYARNVSIESKDWTSVTIPAAWTVRWTEDYDYEHIYPDFAKFTDANIAEMLRHCSSQVENYQLWLLANPFAGGYQEQMLLSAQYPSCRKVTLDFNGAATAQRPESADQKIFYEPEKQPEFEGGTAGLYKHIAMNLKYPEMAAYHGISERITVQFVVETDGTVSNAKVIRGQNEELKAEAIRVIKTTSGKWTPGALNGEPVRVSYTVPVNFHIQPL